MGLPKNTGMDMVLLDIVQTSSLVAVAAVSAVQGAKIKSL